MSLRAIGIVACAAMFLLAPAVRAQSNTTSGLIGRVTDDSGGALPGATVEIASPALIGGVHASVTDAHGEYRFAQISPGVYTVTVTLGGYRRVIHTDIRLLLGQTTSLSTKLQEYAGEETVTVTAGASMIDPTSSAVPTVLTDSYLRNIPNSRFQPDTLNLAPGINESSAYGGGGESANSWQIDGVDTSDPDTGTSWSFLNYNIMEEVQLVGLGAPAEYGGFTGVVFNSITKSGGNELTGLVDGYFENSSLTSKSAQFPGFNPTIESFHDNTFQVGGPFVKDKLWYFVSAQYFQQVTNNGGPSISDKEPRVFAKLNWQASPKNEFQAWLEWDRYDIDGRDGSSIVPLEATVIEKAPEYVWNFGWKSTISPDTILNVAFTGYTGYYYLDPHEGYDLAGHYDAATGLYNTNATYYYLADRARNQLNVSLSHHASDFIKGNHDFKFGMEIERATLRSRYGYPTGVKFYDNYLGYDPSTKEYTNYTAAYYGGSYDVHAENERLSLYAQDSWHVTPRWTVNPGVRIDMNRGYVQGDQVFHTNPVAPRIGFVWDMAGNGKTLLKGHYGRYYEALFAAYYYWAKPNLFEPLVVRNLWTDSGFVEDVATFSKRYVIDPHLRQPYLDQIILGVDRELSPGFTLSGTLVYRKNKDFIESVSGNGQFEPVSGYVPAEGLPDSAGNVHISPHTTTGQQVTLYNYLNPESDFLLVTNPSGLERTYKALILAATKRLTTNWQVMTSFVYSEARGNIDNLDTATDAGQNGGPSSFLDTPNSLVNSDGRLSFDQRDQFKLQWTYEIPHVGLSVSGNLTYHSGDTYTRRADCLLTDDGDGLNNDGNNGALGDGRYGCYEFAQGTVRYFAEPRGSRRLPARQELDLRVEWTKAIRGGEFGLILDTFNLANRVRVTDVETRDEGNFEAPLTASLPRQYRLGARYSW
jgi:outer membrane receptor protein involved in Fe transport